MRSISGILFVNTGTCYYNMLIHLTLVFIYFIIELIHFLQCVVLKLMSNFTTTQNTKPYSLSFGVSFVPSSKSGKTVLFSVISFLVEPHSTVPSILKKSIINLQKKRIIDNDYEHKNIFKISYMY